MHARLLPLLLPANAPGFRRPLACLLLAAGLATASSAAPPLAEGPALTFFSTLTEAPFARLEADAVSPRHRRHGPFRVPAVGVSTDSPRLAFHDEACTADDWARFLRAFVAFRQTCAKSELLLTTPDDRIFVFLGAPSSDATVLAGSARLLVPGDSAKPFLLRIRHDGVDRLRFEPPLASTPTANSPPTPER